jgi:hypothetical protein
MLKNFNINRVLLILLIIFIPLYPKFPLFHVDSTYVAVRLDDIVISLCLLAWFISQIKNKFPVRKNKLLPLFIAYFIAIFISQINSFFIFQDTSASLLLLNFLRRIEYMSLFFITIDAIKTKKDLGLIYKTLLVSTLGIAIYGYGQKYFQFPVISTMNAEFSKGTLLHMDVWTRINSTFAGHYDLAAFLSMTLIPIGAIVIISKNKLEKFLSLIAWFVSFNLLTLTASRVSIFAFWGSFTILLFLIKKYLWIIPLTLIVLISMTSSKDLNRRLLATIPSIRTLIPQKAKPSPIPQPTAIPSIVASVTSKPIANNITATPIPTIFRHKIEEFTPIDEDFGVARSGEIRFNVEWPRAINAFKKNVVAGTGLGSITLATDNDYLRLLGESGILGAITLLGILFFLFIKTIHSPDILTLTMFATTLSMLANAIFIDVFEASKVAYTFWILIGIYYQCLHFNKKI